MRGSKISCLCQHLPIFGKRCFCVCVCVWVFLFVWVWFFCNCCWPVCLCSLDATSILGDFPMKSLLTGYGTAWSLMGLSLQIPATTCFGAALSQPVIDGWESRGERWVLKRKEKTTASTEKRARWGWWLWGLLGLAHEAGKLKNTGVRLAGWKESNIRQGAGVGGEEIWDLGGGKWEDKLKRKRN